MREQRGQGDDERDASAGTVLGRAAGRNVNVDVEGRVVVGVDAERRRLAAEVADGGLGAFFHHVAERASEKQAAFAGHPRGFDEEHVAAHRRPGQASGDAAFSDFLHGFSQKRRLAEPLGELVGSERDGRAGPAPADEAPGGLAGERGDLAFELADAGLACEFVDEPAQRGVGQAQLTALQAVFLDLARHEVAASNLELLRLRVARQFDDFQAVAQRRMNRLQPVGGGDEKNSRQVEWQIEVVIGEGAILRRIKDFQQRRCRVTAEVGADLVQLVQQDDRVPALDAPKRLQDAARHGADVGAAVAANLRFVPHAAERDAGELAAQRVGDAAAERGLAHAGRADEAENRPLDLLAEREHGEEFEQALLHLREAKMLFVKDARGLDQIEFVGGFTVPGQAENPVEVVPGDGVIWSRRRDLLKALQFVRGDLAGLGRQRRMLQKFTQSANFRRAGVAFAQLALDGADLLAEVKIAL